MIYPLLLGLAFWAILFATGLIFGVKALLTLIAVGLLVLFTAVSIVCGLRRG